MRLPLAIFDVLYYNLPILSFFSMRNIVLKIILPVISIIAIIGFIAWFSPIKQQQADWYVNHNQYYACQGTNITVHIDPQADSCSGGFNSSLTSYHSTMHVYATGNNLADYTIHWGWAGNFCTEGNASKCINSNPAMTTGSLSANNSVYATSPKLAPTGQYAGLACGSYQTDFGFYVTRNSDNQTMCGISLSNLNYTNNNAGYCHTGNTCTVKTCNSTTGEECKPGTTHMWTYSKDCNSNITWTKDEGPSAQCGATCQELGNCAPTPTNTPTPTNAPTSTPTPTTVATCTGNSCNTQPPQQVLGVATQPSQLPSTGASSDILFVLIALIPVAWKIRKLV